MLFDFLKNDKAKDKLTKSVAIYISETYNQIIIAPRYRNLAGITYEQEICTLLSYPIDYSELGDQVIANLNLFALKDKNLRDEKLTDWPAFKFSKLRSVKLFEQTFFWMSVAGSNESNISLSIKAPLKADKDLLIESYISAHAKKEEIGKRIIKVYEKAIADN